MQGLPINSSEETYLLKSEKEVAPPERERLISLDAARGLTVWFMILVNNADDSFPILSHSPWDGVTIADFVMPSFLFIMGASVALAFYSQLEKETVSRRELLSKAFVRTAKGGNFPYYDLSTLRVMGVLQRIAICYFIVTTFFIFAPRIKREYNGVFSVFTRYAVIWLGFIAFQCIYWGIMFGVNVPECGRGSMVDYCNAAGFVDSKILGLNHMYQTPTCQEAIPPCKYFDPEGLVSTISATASPFIGLYFGLILKHFRSHATRILHWVVPVVAFLTLAFIANYTGLPFNKNLYSTSYVLLLAGFAGGLLILMYVILDVYPTRVGRWVTLPFVGLGMNAIILYFGDEFLPSIIGDRYGQSAMIYWQTQSNSLCSWIYWAWFRATLAPQIANLLWALTDVSFWVVIGLILYWSKVFIKI